MGKFDLASVLDPVELWPDPESCPDYPLYQDAFSRQANAPFSRQDCENQLTRIRYTLNKEHGVRPPTNAEAAAAQAEIFQEGTSPNWRWNALGITGITPARRDNDVAELVVEAVHIRGHLRKLDARVTNAANAKAQSERRSQAEQFDAYIESINRQKVELVTLGEAEARHRERMEDETAFFRASDIRRSLQIDLLVVKDLAQKIGVKTPNL